MLLDQRQPSACFISRYRLFSRNRSAHHDIHFARRPWVQCCERTVTSAANLTKCHGMARFRKPVSEICSVWQFKSSLQR